MVISQRSPYSPAVVGRCLGLYVSDIVHANTDLSEEFFHQQFSPPVMQVPLLSRVTNVSAMYDQRQRLRLINTSTKNSKKGFRATYNSFAGAHENVRKFLHFGSETKAFEFLIIRLSFPVFTYSSRFQMRCSVLRCGMISLGLFPSTTTFQHYS